MNVMLSYRRSDTPFMETLASHLRKNGIHVWIDREGIKPGTKWRNELLNELRSCEGCVPVLSRSYLESEPCRMEIFIARSFGRKIVPVMIDDCSSGLRDHEETRGLEDVFIIRMHRLQAFGLPITESNAFDRIADAVAHSPGQFGDVKPVYVSYSSPDAEFATATATGLRARGFATWVASLDVHAGQNWRDAQARAMMQASCHVVVLDENMLAKNVLRTEILLAEAMGLETLTILPPRLTGQTEKLAELMRGLSRSDQTYRRLADTQYYACNDGLDQMLTTLSESLAARGLLEK